MALITGNPGDDSGLNGTADADVFDLTQGGDDQAFGDSGNDIFLMRSTLTAADQIDGGDDTDRIVLRGDYADGVTMNATSILNIEEIKLAAGYSYSLTTHDATVAAGQVLKVLAGQLGANDDVTFDGSAETDGRFVFFMGAGFDTITGGAKRNAYHLESGGSDEANGGFRIDRFYMGASFDASDSIDGGHGTKDWIYLDGDYTGANALVLGPTTMVDVEKMLFELGHSYDITLDDATSNSYGLDINAQSLGAGDTITVDASAEDDQQIRVVGGSGDDVVTSGYGIDYLPGAGSDTFYGGTASDSVNVFNAFDATDSFDGGAGTDTLYIGTDYASGLTITGTMLSNFESLWVLGFGDLDLTLEDGVVASGKTLGVLGISLFDGQSLRVDGSAETDGAFVLTGGDADDIFIGGALGDTLSGANGTNSLTGNGGADTLNCGEIDTLVYTAGSQSNSSGYDDINLLNLDEDKIDTEIAAPGSVDTRSGTVSAATFDSDMGAFMSDYVATIVNVTGGDLIGKSFLVIDTGGNSYDTGDYVMEITGYTGTFNAGDII